MNVEKVIRVLGYIVYTALWSPVIVIALLATPIVWLGMCIRNGHPARTAIDGWKNTFMTNVRHDMEFIRTGKW